MLNGETMETYTCPVCGYSKLHHPARDPNTGDPSFEICPSCGCEFGYDDATQSAIEKYRSNWISRGAPWFRPEFRPENWSLKRQVKRVGINLDDLNHR